MMFGFNCFSRNRIPDLKPSFPDNFSLPAPVPDWPEGDGFASGRINLGELEVLKITKFESLWCSNQMQDNKTGVSFYKPVGIPSGFSCLGHYCQISDRPLYGFVLVARELTSSEVNVDLPSLCKPLDFTLVWSSDQSFNDSVYFWLPQPPEGYKSMGYVVTAGKEQKPHNDEVRCVRANLTDNCEPDNLILSLFPKYSFRVWTTRPCDRGISGKGVPIGTFFCTTFGEEETRIACLKNTKTIATGLYDSMPNLAQIEALVNQYGPTIFFHPEEVYLPSSVSWFFKNGALLYKQGDKEGIEIDVNGSNLPSGGSNDGFYWIDLDPSEKTKHGNLESAVVYVHVKPASGGTFTDLAMWIFCPFNGPATLKVGIMSINLSKIGRHVCDWEHFTLRVCNFTGELSSVYFSQHSGGKWVNACDLEYLESTNRFLVYSSKNGHACFPRAGCYVQGSAAFGIGVRNDAARSGSCLDTSLRYEIVAAEYLGCGVMREPCWLDFMREWGPTIVYGSTTELDKLIRVLPWALKFSMENMFDKLPVELYGEEGPTGPKEKDNWVGDERS